MRTLPLTSDHVARGARLMAAEGAEVVADFGDVAAELRAATLRAGLLDRCHRAVLALSGPDRVSFLNGQSTSAVAKLAVGQGSYTTLLTGKGKMRGHGVVYAEPERLLFATDAEAAEVARAHLQSFIIMDDVRVDDVSAGIGELAVVGPEAAMRVGEALGRPVDAVAATPYRVETTQLDGLPVAVSSEPAVLGDGLVLRAPVAALPRLWAVLVRTIPPIGYRAQEVLRIERGLPRWGAELDLDTIPIEAGLAHALDYDKGCFTGYEVVARIRTYGHVNRNLVGLALAGAAAPAAGAVVQAEGKSVGAVTSAAASDLRGHAIALAMIRREVAAAGTRVAVQVGDDWRDGEVRTLPFAPIAAGATPGGARPGDGRPQDPARVPR